MELHEIASMLAGLGIPLAYHHFAEGESPAPPFLLYLSPGRTTSPQTAGSI